MSEQEKIAAPYQVIPDSGAQNESLQNAQSFLERNLKLILGIAGGLLAVAVIFYFVKSSNEKKSQEATVALSRVRPYFESGDYAKALAGDPAKTVRGSKISGLTQVADQYSSTEAGKVAALYAGSALMAQQKASEASKYFEIALDSESPIVVVGANAGLAAVKEQSNQYAEAAKLYERAAEIGVQTGSEVRYKMFAGVAYEKAGDKGKAEEIYREVVGREESNEYGKQAKAGLIRLGTVIE